MMSPRLWHADTRGQPRTPEYFEKSECLVSLEAFEDVEPLLFEEIEHVDEDPVFG